MSDDKKESSKPPTAQIMSFAERKEQSDKDKMAERIDILSNYIIKKVGDRLSSGDVAISRSSNEKSVLHVQVSDENISTNKKLNLLVSDFHKIFAPNIKMKIVQDRVTFMIEGEVNDLIAMIRKVDPAGLSPESLGR